MEVYISTNNEQPGNCFAEINDKRKATTLVAELNTTNPKKVAEGVFLIHQDLNSIIVDKSNACLLRHTTITESVVNAFNPNLIKTGQHEQGEASLYAPIFKILLNEAITEKLTEILKILGFTDTEVREKNTLESKLNFLHHCLTPDGLKNEEVANSDWAMLEEFTKLTAAKDGPFGENYLSALRTLRDKLLVS